MRRIFWRITLVCSNCGFVYEKVGDRQTYPLLKSSTFYVIWKTKLWGHDTSCVKAEKKATNKLPEASPNTTHPPVHTAAHNTVLSSAHGSFSQGISAPPLCCQYHRKRQQCHSCHGGRSVFRCLHCRGLQLRSEWLGWHCCLRTGHNLEKLIIFIFCQELILLS